MIVSTICFIYSISQIDSSNRIYLYEQEPSKSIDIITNTIEDNSDVSFIARNNQLDAVCNKYQESDTKEHDLLHTLPGGPGVETVLLPGDPPVTVCIPHKVSSHAWGVFARELEKIYPQRINKLRSLNWTERSKIVRKAVVVRHPLDRLVSAYRMIFQVQTKYASNAL